MNLQDLRHLFRGEQVIVIFYVLPHRLTYPLYILVYSTMVELVLAQVINSSYEDFMF